MMSSDREEQSDTEIDRNELLDEFETSVLIYDERPKAWVVYFYLILIHTLSTKISNILPLPLASGSGVQRK